MVPRRHFVAYLDTAGSRTDVFIVSDLGFRAADH